MYQKLQGRNNYTQLHNKIIKDITWIGVQTSEFILAVRYLIKPSLELRSQSKRKISKIWKMDDPICTDHD